MAGRRLWDSIDSIRDGFAVFDGSLRLVVANSAYLAGADLAGAHPGFTVTLDPAALHTCSQVLMTSTVLLNGSLDAVLAQCASARRVAMIGPGAGCLPQPLFDRGITALGGTWIDDGPGFVSALRRGEPWGRFARKVLWQRPEPPA